MYYIKWFTYIELATKLLHFFPLDDFSRSKSFFSIANFILYMVFDNWRFIDYSVNRKLCFFIFIVLHWFEMEIPDGHFRNILIYYFRRGKNAV